ncbi:hypothetical protein OK18_19075 [Chryseobacterium gallinarum]|uniref:Uncharacterized protein n=1 Tax=Chryseobacterium gallinarum TaxID=1324352 RepID=A0A0G3M775_CHRGL|nr:hypothetical protein [Chryseobacterium gallinarum]AKK74435.1 hypothetical protein OK18_19075 [Chryseobacterium gallinarum]
MATPEQLRAGFESLAKSLAPAVSNIARVKSVNESQATCILIDEDDQEFLDVRLKPVISDNKSFLQIPKIGTYVLAVRVEDDDDWMVVATDQVDKFLWVVGDTKLELTDKICMEANNQNMLNLLQRLFTVIERGYQTNMGVTIQLILQDEFLDIKDDFKKLLK